MAEMTITEVSSVLERNSHHILSVVYLKLNLTVIFSVALPDNVWIKKRGQCP